MGAYMVINLKPGADSVSFFGKNAAWARCSFLLLTAISLTFSDCAVAEEIIRVGGTGTGMLLIQRASKSYAKLRPDVQVQAVMPPLGGNGGLRALAAGAVQITIVSIPAMYPAKPDEMGENKIIPLARTPFVFTGHGITSATKLTLKQVADIYSGSLTQWPDGQPIKLVTRTERESDARILRAISPEMETAMLLSLKRAGMLFAENDFDNQRMLEQTAGSFGMVGLGQLLLTDSPLKPFSLDGVSPSPESLQSGAYRWEKPMYLVIPKTPSAATLEFVQYLQSPGFMKSIRPYGFIPMQR